MEKTADKVSLFGALLEEKLACYQQLHQVLKAEKKAIGTIELGIIWETTRAKKDLVRKIEKLRNDIFSICQNHYPRMYIKTDPFSLAAIINALPLSNKSKGDIRQLKRTIDKEKDIVDHLIKSNQIQVKKHLSFVDNIMALIGNNPSQARYTGKGMVTQARKNNCLFAVEG